MNYCTFMDGLRQDEFDNTVLLWIYIIILCIGLRQVDSVWLFI